ncbi:PEPxxWA-CTERM sorting domain-containing protein [Phenylobacterium sp.]|uniref:PEPxxWA-CTERM sorting domain-containing protein n=1 Tax=Phenylobacterium sp. TaxID=1871053 RepID=UPI0025DA06E1|nr:PEPxxWA-CTERM sorting domain-containing protein [Phenylobacterium sp.]
MFRFATFAAATAVALTLAAPASATTTFNLGGSNTTLATGAALTQTKDGITISATGYTFASSPITFQNLMSGADAATVLSGLTAKSIRREATGIGVCWSGEAGNQCNQVDADGPNEILRIVVSEGVSLLSATFDRVDNNDTLKLYGVTMDGKLQHLGYGGIFDGAGTSMGVTGANGGAWLSGTGDDQVYQVNLNTAGYKEFWFGNNNDAADGYRLDSLTVTAVPEPTTWALMIGGFGLAGAALRRRRSLAVAMA